LSRLELFFFNFPRIERNATELHFERHKALALLVYLAVTRQSHSRDALAALFWPGYSQSAARSSLRICLLAIKDALGSEYLEVDRDNIRLLHLDDLWLDVGEFQKNMADWRVHAHTHPQEPCPECLSFLSRAVELYINDFMSGFNLPDCPDFDDWQIFQREGLRKDMGDALATLSEGHAARGEYEPAIAYARRWLALDPLNELAHCQLMRLYTSCGQRQLALRQYKVMEETLQREMDVEPALESQHLREQILGGELAPQEIPFEWLFLPHHNLPALLSSFIGREGEIKEIRDLVCAKRLVTLTGAGGVGKTRLALKVAESLLGEFAQGVYWAEMASISNPAQVAKAVCEIFHLLERPGQSETEMLAAFLKERHMLLLIDNGEHVIGSCALLIEALLKVCPHLHILATSRIRLNLTGETSYRVPSLAIPEEGQLTSLEELAQNDSVHLFCERALSHSQEFALTAANAKASAHICQRLDGIPLAIELAAARTRIMSTEQIAARLEDSFSLLTEGNPLAPPRHKTLRASIDWSYSLLCPKEKDLLQRLTVFAGGWTLEAAEAVYAGSNDAEMDDTKYIGTGEVLDLLTGLVDQSLVKVEAGGQETRYRMLEMIRQYGHEKLVGEGQAGWAYQKHLEYFLRLAEQAEPGICGPQQLIWLRRLNTERSNITSALEKAFDSSSTIEIGVRMVCALSRYWDSFSDFYTGSYWRKRALSQSKGFGRTATRAKILFTTGSQSAWGPELADKHEIQIALEESLDIWQELGSDFIDEQAYCILSLGFMQICNYDEKGFNTMQTALTIFQKTGNTWWQARALNLIMFLKALKRYDDPEIRQGLQDEIVLWEITGDRWGLAHNLYDLGETALKRGEFVDAMEHFLKSLEIWKELGSKGMSFQVIRNIAETARGLKEYDLAEMYYQNCEELHQETGLRIFLSVIYCGLGFLALRKDHTQKAENYFRLALKAAREIDSIALFALFNEKLAFMRCVAAFASLAAARGEFPAAAHLFGALFGQTDQNPLTAVDQLETNPYIEICKARLNQAIFAEEWSLGKAMSLEQTLAYIQEAFH
jgi:predicted ATPase/DNA-binding SARP family transcriptional activator